MTGLGTSKPTIADVQKAVCERKGLTIADLKSKDRSRRLSYPRQVAMVLARELTGKSYPAIGRAFNRDHTVTIFNEKKLRAILSKNPKLAVSMQLYRERIAQIAASRQAVAIPVPPSAENPNYVKWTDVDVQTLRNLWATLSDKEISLRLGSRHSASSVRNKARNIGLSERVAA